MDHRIKSILIGLLLFLATFLVVGAVMGQNVVQRGNVFIEQKDSIKSSIPTEYTFKSKDGKVYPVYLSKNGNAYIIMTSKKSGKQYRRYLPDLSNRILHNKWIWSNSTEQDN